MNIDIRDPPHRISDRYVSQILVKLLMGSLDDGESIRRDILERVIAIPHD